MENIIYKNNSNSKKNKNNLFNKNIINKDYSNKNIMSNDDFEIKKELIYKKILENILKFFYKKSKLNIMRKNNFVKIIFINESKNQADDI